MVTRLLHIIILFSIILTPQEKQIEKKRQELEKIKSELQQLQNELNTKSKKEKLTYESYNNLNRQSHLISKVISSIQKEENLKQVQIEQIKKEISLIESEIASIKKTYEKYIISIYKYGKVSELESIVEAKSFNQIILRLKYLREFSERRKSDINRLTENINKLSERRAMLTQEFEEKAKLRMEKESEIVQLNKRINEEKKLLALLRKDKSNLSRKLNDRKKAELQIKNLISKLIEESEKKREVIASNDKKVSEKKIITNESDYDIDLSTNNFTSFSAMKGMLSLPVSKGRIITRFGEKKNPVLNTVTVSYGIDILARGDLSVKVVADGVISAIEWLPGYGTVIIVTHKGGYKTVYGHLAEIYVSEGDKLKTGGLIGKVGETLEGNVLHFQIWNGRQSVDPENWLRK